MQKSDIVAPVYVASVPFNFVGALALRASDHFNFNRTLATYASVPFNFIGALALRASDHSTLKVARR